MPTYREIVPPAALAGTVECFWIMQPELAPAAPYRVTPDGCADIVFTRGTEQTSLRLVGAMTRFEDFHLPPQTLTVGMRFRPGKWARRVGVPADSITDQLLALDDVWGRRARQLAERLADAASAAQIVEQLGASLERIALGSPVQHAIEWMERERGLISLDDAARQANLSVRQFRRVCLRETGLSPKLLARILRFRHALARIRNESGEHAGLAAECGYTDQSHLIAEFHTFSGRTPAAIVRASLT